MGAKQGEKTVPSDALAGQGNSCVAGSELQGQWEEVLQDFSLYLRFTRGLADNTIVAYLGDVRSLAEWAVVNGRKALQLQSEDLECFLNGFSEELLAVSQARLISSLRSFWRFMIVEHGLDYDITEELVRPRLSRHMPVVLSAEEVERMQASLDLSNFPGHRNHAILEVLFSCGLRVSELVELRYSDLFLSEGYLKVVGKGNKERLVPMGQRAEHDLLLLRELEGPVPPRPGEEDRVFLNRYGGALSRQSVFQIVRATARAAGIEREVSPHTLRHSFATALVLAGADIRLVQMMLGHENLSTTAIYTHFSTRELQEAHRLYHPRGQR